MRMTFVTAVISLWLIICVRVWDLRFSQQRRWRFKNSGQCFSTDGTWRVICWDIKLYGNYNFF